MAIFQGVTDQAKYTALTSISSGGVLKMALYTASASLGADTLVYTTDGEVSSSGTGYTAGGKILTDASTGSSSILVTVSDGVAYLSFSTVTWDPANFTARGALIYNTGLSNLAVAVLDFGANKTATNTFSVQFPPASSTSAIIRLS